jgi:cell division protease FtsH
MASPKPKSTPRFNPRGGDRRGPRQLGSRPGASLWYALAFVLLIGLVQMYYLTPGGRAIPYSEFKELVKRGAVAEVTVGEQLLRGKLKEAVGTGAQASVQFTTNRVEDPKLAEELESHGVKYSGEMVNRWLPELLGWLLPLLFFVAIWGCRSRGARPRYSQTTK